MDMSDPIQRLAWRVLQETGGGLAVPLDDLGNQARASSLIKPNRDCLAVDVVGERNLLAPVDPDGR